MVTHADTGGRPPQSTTGGRGGGLLVGLLALACPLLCLGPVLLVGLASTGLIRALGGAPWPLIVGAVLIMVALGVWRTRSRRTPNCCAPGARPNPLREAPHESAR